MAYIQGQSRSQTSLFPVSLEELIPEDHLVRVIDTYVACPHKSKRPEQVGAFD